MSAADRRAKVPGGLLDQWNLVRAASQDARLSRTDIAVLIAVLQRYQKKHKNGWASLDMLAEISTVSRRQVIRVLRTLQDAGYLAVLEKGRRGRSTIYAPDFTLGHRFGDNPVTETSPQSFSDTHGTETPEFSDGLVTETAGLGDTPVTPSYLLNPAYKAGVQYSNSGDCAAPTAPGVAVAGSPAPPDTAQGFEELWQAYGYPHGFPEAEAAYAKIDPGADLHREMVAAANEWRRSWKAQAAPGGRRFSLEKWLTRKEYRCDPPTAYKPKERPAKPKPQASPPAPANDAEPRATADRAFPAGTTEARVLRTELRDEGGDQILKIKFATPTGNRENEIITASEYLPHVAERGLAELAALCRALGLPHIDDTDEMHGKVLRITADGAGSLTYFPAEEAA